MGIIGFGDRFIAFNRIRTLILIILIGFWFKHIIGADGVVRTIPVVCASSIVIWQGVRVVKSSILLKLLLLIGLPVLVLRQGLSQIYKKNYES